MNPPVRAASAAPRSTPTLRTRRTLARLGGLAVATTLITLAMEHTRRARRAPAAATRRCVIGAAVCGAVILAVMLGIVRPRAPVRSTSGWPSPAPGTTRT